MNLLGYRKVESLAYALSERSSEKQGTIVEVEVCMPPPTDVLASLTDRPNLLSYPSF